MIAAWDARIQDLSNCEELEGIAALECELAAELAHNEKLEKIGDDLYACQFGALVAYVNCLNAAEKAYDECVDGCGEISSNIRSVPVCYCSNHQLTMTLRTLPSM